MSIFAIVLLSPNEGVEKRLFEKYPKGYKFNSTLYLVQADALAEQVAMSVGVKGDNREPDASGFVIKLERYSYSGYTQRSLWDWLSDAESD